MNSMGVGEGDRDGTASGTGWSEWDETREVGVGRLRQCMGEDTSRYGWGNETVGRECAGVRGRLRGGGIRSREGTKPI